MSDNQKALDYLQHCPFRQALAPADLEALAAICAPVEHGANELLFKELDVAEHIYLLCSGSVEFATAHYRGKPIRFGYPLEPGHFFGEVAALSKDQQTGAHTRTAAARACQAVTGVKLTWKAFKGYVREHPNAEFLLDVLVEDMAGRLRRSGRDLSLFHLKHPNEGLVPEGFDELIKKFAGACGSGLFFWGNVLLLALWFCGWFWFGKQAGIGFDSAVGVLGLFVTVEALLVTTIVLNSQNREAKYESKRADTQYDNVKEAVEAIQKLQEDVKGLHAQVNDHFQTPATPPSSRQIQDNPAVQEKTLPLRHAYEASSSTPETQTLQAGQQENL